MHTVLMVAEKPSLAQTIASILSGRQCTSRKGFNGACSVHEWAGTFRGQQARFKMTSVCGHVMSLDFLARYNNWDRVDPAELFTAGTEKKETTPKLRMREFLRGEARGCTTLVLWLDCDREGENICFEVIDAVASVMDTTLGQTVFRAKFSAITDRDIRAAMNQLVLPNVDESRSVDARQELDLRIGCCFTRFQTKYFQDKYGDLDSTLISYGPCQTPTLGFCVERHDRIQSFKPEPFWKLAVSCQTANGVSVQLQWSRRRCFDKEVALMFLQRTSAADFARVDRVESGERRKRRPNALNTVQLMRVGSAALGMSPQYAMSLAERLYIQGYISYPRTETTQYSANFDITGTLRQLKHSCDGVWATEIEQLLGDGVRRPAGGVDVGDHPPITPTRAASRAQLDTDSWRLYDYVTRHFIASVHRDCLYSVTTATLTLQDENFSVSGRRVIDPGFTAVFDWMSVGTIGTRDDDNDNNENDGDQDENDEQNLSAAVDQLVAGQTLTVTERVLTEHQTSAPRHLTESELILLMERHGIGTDASIPVHINNIGQRNYVSVEQGRRLVPTTLGTVLVHGYQKIDPDLVLPTMRAGVERQLCLIAQGRADFAAVLQHTLHVFQRKFRYFVTSVSLMDQLFETSFSPLAASGKPLSRCGRCRRYMRLVTSRPQRLHCVACSATYALPVGGCVRVYNELKCPLDQFELLVWTEGGGKRGRSLALCPYCYNHPPFSEMGRGGACGRCLHPSCQHAVNACGVSGCVECDGGVLTLEASSTPHWKLCCNRCDVTVSLFDQASRVIVTSHKCGQCDAFLLHVEYKQGKSRLADGALSAEGCVFCSDQLRRLVHIKHCHNSTTRGRARRGRSGHAPRQQAPPPRDKMSQLAAYFL